MKTSERKMTFLLAEPERRLLRAVAARVPRSLRSNHFTVLGVIGAVGTGAAYALSTFDAAWLWVASLMLVVNWFGDSLDGTLARVRQTERPRYGYYLDHVVDAFNTAAIGIGLGLSPFVSSKVALALVVVYLMLSINVYLESQVFGKFKMAYARIGPTEARIALIVVNTLIVAGSTLRGVLETTLVLFTNTAVGLLSAAMFTVLVIRFGKNLHRLARLEPQELGRH